MSDDKINEELTTITNYSENLKIIKDLLFDVKIKTIYERWAFYMWGTLIILAGTIHFVIEGLYTLKPVDYLVFIWVPVMIVAGLLELISFIRNLSKQALSIFSRPIVKFFLGLVLLSLMIIFTSVFLFRYHHFNYIPIFLTFAASGFFVLYSVSTHINYLLPAVFLTAFSVILFFFSIPTRLLILICSICIGIAWISGGIICFFLEKKE